MSLHRAIYSAGQSVPENFSSTRFLHSLKIRHRLSQRFPAKSRKSVQPITRDLENLFLYQQTAGFLTCLSTRITAFPNQTAQWLTMTQIIRSLLTVTRSYRNFTCFPFTHCPHRRTAAPAALNSICFLSYHFNGKNAIRWRFN